MRYGTCFLCGKTGWMEEHHVFLFLCSIKLVCASCDVANGCAKQQIVHNEKVFVGDRIVSVS